MKTAIILSARKESTSSMPYPLREFTDGVCLIDRTLAILRENNYSKIIIVAGYRSDLFEKYISDDVTVVVNDDYEFTASMGSLALCKDLVDDDFLLVEGDTFYEKSVIERMSSIESGNCISMTEESGSGDECFVETKSGFVTKITKDRHRVRNFEGEMIGVTRISYATFQKLIEAWTASSNPYLNYEYLLMDVTDVLDRPYVHFKSVI